MRFAPPLLLALCAALPGQEAKPPAAGAPESAAPESVAPESATSQLRPRWVVGRVVDVAGQPVVGAGVVLGSAKSMVTEHCLTRPLARTDADGRFGFWLQPPQVEPAKNGAAQTGPAQTGAAQGEAAKSGPPTPRSATPRPASPAETEAQRREYLQVFGEGWTALWRKMPVVDHSPVPRWKQPATAAEQAGRLGFDLLARIRGAGDLPGDDVDLEQLVLRSGVTLRGQVLDDGGKPVAGARLTARDLMSSGRFRGVDGSRGDYRSFAVSGADGGFVLPGLFATGSTVSLEAEGYYRHSRPVTGSADLRITLRRSPEVSGRIVDSQGAAAKAEVEVRFESTSQTQKVEVGDDGRFGFRPQHPHRLRLQVTPKGDSAKEHVVTYSPVVSVPRPDLVVQLAKKEPAKPETSAEPERRPGVFERAAKLGLPVTVVDRQTGRPLQEFKAGAVWVAENYRDSEAYYLGRLSSVGKTSKQPGYIRVQGPQNESAPKGAVVVSAPGYANFVRMGLRFDPRRLPHVIAEMEPESILGGVVRSKATGGPIAGARVYLYPMSDSGRTNRSVTASTDKAGRFRFEGLSAGRYRCRLYYNNTNVHLPVVELGAEEKRCDLSFEVGAARAVRGRITGVKPGKGYEVQLLSESHLATIRYNPGYRPSENRVGLLADGRFEIEGIAPGFYEVVLYIPRPEQPGEVMAIPLEPVRVRERDLELRIDAAEDLPGRLAGRIAFAAEKLDPTRLMVVVAPYVPSSLYTYWGYNNVDMSGAKCQVRADGTFAVDVPSGKHRVRVFDLLTGVLLSEGRLPVLVRSGQESSAPVELTLVRVRVELRPKTEGGRINATWLNIAVQQPLPEAMQMFGFFGGYSGKRATGISLSGTGGTVELVLPELQTKFQVYTEVAQLARTEDKPNNEVGSAEVTPKAGEVNRVEIEVEVPEQGFDPQPKAPPEPGKDGDKGAAK